MCDCKKENKRGFCGIILEIKKSIIKNDADILKLTEHETSSITLDGVYINFTGNLLNIFKHD